MTLEMLKGKIHRATVTQAELDYVGSITVDEALLEAAGILEYEKVQIVDINNGNRFETYTICGQRGSGMICLNGAAARCVSVGDKVIIMAYAGYEAGEVRDLNFDIEIVGCPIIREEDGLAKSSRNTYLNPQERQAALCLSRAVKRGQELIAPGMDSEAVLSEMRKVIEAEPLAKIDYVSMVDALTMKDVEKVDRDVLVAMAVYIGKTRLIDNFSYEV